jgi:TRAP-type C4-dicarboxylate transport system substrate-binding protein
MTQTNSRITVLGAAALTAFAGLATQASADALMSYATYFNSNDPLVQVDIWFMEQVTERSNGTITFDQYIGGAMLGGPEIYPGLSRGAVDVGMSVPSAFHPTEYILTNVTLPYITDNSVATTYAFNQLYKELPELMAEYESRNIHLLYGLSFPENNIWSNKPIQTVEDLSGMRIRSVMSIADALQILGAVPVSMNFADAVSGLQRSLLDGISSAPFLTTMAFGVHEFAPYVSDGGGMGIYAVSSTGINMDVWAGLTPEEQAIFTEVAAEVPDYYASIMNELVSQNVDKLHAAGVTEVIVMSEEESTRVRDAVTEPLWHNWLTAANGAGYAGRDILDRYIALVREGEAKSEYTPGLDLYMDRYGKE